MNYIEFMNNIDKARGVYLIDSKEDFLSDTIIKASKDLVNIKDFNLTELRGEDDYEKIKTSLETYPVMEDLRVLILKDIDLSKKEIKNYSHILDRLIEDIKDIPSYSLFLIFSTKAPFKGKFYKKVKEYGHIVEIEKLNRKELMSFIGRRFLSSKKRISKALISDIIDRFSYLSKGSDLSLYDLVNTIDKIIANTDKEVIEKEDVEDQLRKILNLNIFNLTDALSSKDTKKALETYLYMKNDGEDIFMIYYMIIRQVRNLLGIKLLTDKGFNDSSIRKYLGLSPFELKKDRGFVRNFTSKELFTIHQRLYKMDLRQKSGDFDMDRELIILIGKFSK
ncbi:MAG: DNA polymerase III subunit delta [Anaerococcus sp.]|nr:DNA polymerase III subunit delta [Anaerococcus sp.]